MRPASSLPLVVFRCSQQQKYYTKHCRCSKTTAEIKTAFFWDMPWCNMMDKPKVSEQSAASIFSVEGDRKKLKYEKAKTKFVYCLGEPGGGGVLPGCRPPRSKI